MELDEALGVLGKALDAAGMPRWEAPGPSPALGELQAAIAPMRLPSDVAEFWRRVDVRTLTVEPYPAFATPEFALEAWLQDRSEFAAFRPLALVIVGYTSHDCMSVELDVGDVAGGALFESFISDPAGGFARRFNSIGDWLAHSARHIVAGSYLRAEDAGRPRLIVPHPHSAEAEQKAPPVAGPHPVHGGAAHIGGDILDWPDHWRRANGLDTADTVPRGTTHTLSDLLASPPTETVRATVAAKVISLAGSRVRVNDGTGQLDIACPPETTLLGPRLGDWFEFDVVVAAGERHVPVDPDTAAAGIDDPLDQVSAVLMARHGGPAGATATAIRRIAAP